MGSAPVAAATTAAAAVAAPAPPAARTSSSMPSSAARSASSQPARRAASICSGVTASSSSIAAAAGCHSRVTTPAPAATARCCSGRPLRGSGVGPATNPPACAPVSRTTRVDSSGRGYALPCTPAMYTTASASMPRAVTVGAQMPMSIDARRSRAAAAATSSGSGRTMPGTMSISAPVDAAIGGSAGGCTAIGYPCDGPKACLWSARRLRRSLGHNGVHSGVIVRFCWAQGGPLRGHPAARRRAKSGSQTPHPPTDPYECNDQLARGPYRTGVPFCE